MLVKEGFLDLIFSSLFFKIAFGDYFWLFFSVFRLRWLEITLVWSKGNNLLCCLCRWSKPACPITAPANKILCLLVWSHELVCSLPLEVLLSGLRKLFVTPFRAVLILSFSCWTICAVTEHGYECDLVLLLVCWDRSRHDKREMVL